MQEGGRGERFPTPTPPPPTTNNYYLLLTPLPEQLSKKAITCLLFEELSALYQNKYTAPSLSNGRLDVKLRLSELCSLRLDWDIDGNELVCDWSHLPPEERLLKVASIFGKTVPVCLLPKTPITVCTLRYQYMFLAPCLSLTQVRTGLHLFRALRGSCMCLAGTRATCC